jgi:hypothetical protein
VDPWIPTLDVASRIAKAENGPMASPKPSQIPADRIVQYDRLIATIAGIERKGATVPYTSLNGHMYSYLSPTGSLVLRLQPPDRARFLAEFGTTLHEAHRIVQKEYVDVPDREFEATAAVAPWFAASHDWIATLKPKPTTRRRSG